MFGFFGRNPQGTPPTFKIFCKVDERSCLAVRDGTLVLAAPNHMDGYQHWFKDVYFSIHIKDKEGNPVFSLVNKATGLAIQHPSGPSRPVRLTQFCPEILDESVLWTESGDMCKDFCFIRMKRNIRYNLDAVRGGTSVVLSEGPRSDSQMWKMTPWSGETHSGWIAKEEPTFRIRCRAPDGDSSITIRNGTVRLAPSNPRDKYQYWFCDRRPGEFLVDEDGYPALALVNRVTGEAIAASGKGCPLKLKSYNPNYLDGSVLWTTSFDMGHGFRCIHMVDNLSLNFDACVRNRDISTSHGSPPVGTIMLSHWRPEDNLELQWEIIKW